MSDELMQRQLDAVTEAVEALLHYFANLTTTPSNERLNFTALIDTIEEIKEERRSGEAGSGSSGRG